MGEGEMAEIAADEILEPELEVCDPPHHLWDWVADSSSPFHKLITRHRYLLPEIFSDLNSGHNVRRTVSVEALTFYRAGGPEELRLVGETEFVNGVAAMSASGRYGDTRICDGIVA